MTLKSIWDSALKLDSPNAFYQFSLDINTYLLPIWPFLPLPTSEAQDSFLNQWVSTQKDGSGNASSQVYPPGVFQTGTSATGTSRLTTIATSPDVLFGSSLGASFLLLSLLEVIHLILENLRNKANNARSSSSEPSWARRPKFLRIIAQSMIGVIICIFANVENNNLSSKYKLVVLFAISIFQFMLTETFRILTE
jgi:hypothetical protein